MSEQIVKQTTTEIHGQHLQVRLNGRSLFNLSGPMSNSYQLTLELDNGQHTIWLRYASKGAAKLFSSDDQKLAESIMDATANALQSMAIKEKRKAGYSWLIPGAMAVFLVGAWTSSLWHSSSSVQPPVWVMPPQPPALSLESTPVESPAPALVKPSPAVSVGSTVPTPAAEPGSLSAEEAAEARNLLATRLKNGAAKQEFTIQLSSGHPRTLYIFADPECPNCKIFEPTVQAFSSQYNIEIFPVTLIGKARTAEQVVPMLCAPADKRADMWRSLFDIGAGMLNPNAKSDTPASSCEAGQNALARNDMAFELYKLPGTPTVITDDGRLVPLQAMTSDAAMQAFMNNAQ
ncbi:DsbC family protein [Pectobacterium carotovorum]|uniref:DsbC family protein n=1 Tax=Pectobacterium carotovorum TaxID=554 RepID=UPI0029DE2948|nr:DsbC family protein [Pectobacterium carotovorum]MDX6917834.1 DsbC family protein [Pectobacterium carotovorum]